jgi:hypothetical protein
MRSFPPGSLVVTIFGPTRREKSPGAHGGLPGFSLSGFSLSGLSLGGWRLPCDYVTVGNH